MNRKTENSTDDKSEIFRENRREFSDFPSNRERAFPRWSFFTNESLRRCLNILSQFHSTIARETNEKPKLGKNFSRSPLAERKKTFDSESKRKCFSKTSSISIGTVAQSQRGLLASYKSFASKLISQLMLNRFSFVFAVKVVTSVRTYFSIFETARSHLHQSTPQLFLIRNFLLPRRKKWKCEEISENNLFYKSIKIVRHQLKRIFLPATSNHG